MIQKTHFNRVKCNVAFKCVLVHTDTHTPRPCPPGQRQIAWFVLVEVPLWLCLAIWDRSSQYLKRKWHSITVEASCAFTYLCCRMERRHMVVRLCDCCSLTLFLQHAISFLNLGFIFKPQSPAVEDLRHSVFHFLWSPRAKILPRRTKQVGLVSFLQTTTFTFY